MIKLNDKNIRNIVAESIKNVIKEYGYDSNPGSGYEKYTELGESMAYQTIDALKKYGMYRKIDEYGDGLDEEAIEHIISGFKHALVSLVDVGNPDGGVKGLGVKSAI